MKEEFVRNPYNYDSDQVSEDTGLRCEDETMTEQEHLEEADINYIAERFMKTGQAPQLLQLPTVGDFEGIFDFQTAMNTIATAREEFMRLPAKTRSRFNNDPSELLEFVNDKENYDEAVKLGFIPKKGHTDGPIPARGTEEIPQSTARTRGAKAAQTTSNATETTGSETTKND